MDAINKESFPNSHVPNYKRLKHKSRVLFRANVLFKGKEDYGDWCLLNFTEELKDIVQTNVEMILKYETERDRKMDIQIPDCFDSSRQCLNIYLILNSDGVRLIASDSKSIWPVWLGVANLPPVSRSSFKNIVLAALWFGSKKPNWDNIFQVGGD